jgi:hypothetical protein
MFKKIKNLVNKFFSKSRTINNESINKLSLIIIIIIDIFILANVFSGLDDIGRWYISPSKAYPCYFEWENYHQTTAADKDYNVIKSSLQENTNFQAIYKQQEEGHIGKVSPICLRYARDKDQLNNPENRQILANIQRKQNQISDLEKANINIRKQYDSTLLEKIAGQSRERSINNIAAEKAKEELENNNWNIAILQQDIKRLKNQIFEKKPSVDLLSFLQSESNFNNLKQNYNRGSFWYPSIEIIFQFLFLVPLIFAGLSIHRFAERKGHGLISLMSWHLLVIFFIPLVVKIFQFLQIGVIFQFLFDFISSLLSGLIFLISYVYIVLIPFIGFGIIKFFQAIIFNPKLQAANRVEKSKCIQCAKQIRSDSYCPHCGYYQYLECPHCGHLTYKLLSYCKECGSSLPTSS